MTSLFYDYVPRDPVENLKWRIRCRERALKDSRFRDALYQAAMMDPLFFLFGVSVGTRAAGQN